MDKAKLLGYLTKTPSLARTAVRARNMLGRNHFSIQRGNTIRTGLATITGTTIIIRGTGNTIRIGDDARLKHCSVRVFGSYNTIDIGDHVLMNEAELWVEDARNSITIGRRTVVSARTQLSAIEGTSITVGEDCLLSSDIRIVTGDSHSIVDSSGERTNTSQSITIENHVWIGARVLCLKGTHISKDSVVGAGSLLTSRFVLPNVVIAGSPARVLKTDMNWLSERI